MYLHTYIYIYIFAVFVFNVANANCCFPARLQCAIKMAKISTYADKKSVDPNGSINIIAQVVYYCYS